MEPPEKKEMEVDLPPEFCHYKDEGCELSSSCLNCPFTRCIDEEPGGKQHWLKLRRAREMARLYLLEEKSIPELAIRFAVSERTVRRALKSVLVNIKRPDQKGLSAG